MTSSGRAIAALALAIGAIGSIGSLGCKARDKRAAPPARPAPIPEAEVATGKAACDDLVARICACASAHPERPELRERCELDKARPEALALALETAARAELGADAILGAQRTVRVVIDKCVTAVAALPNLGCL